MSAAPLLRVIDGGLSVVEAAPELPSPGDGDRLYPALMPEGAGAFVHVAAVSLILHGALVAASVAWSPFGEERAAGGLEELLVIEGVNVVLLDQAPGVPAPLAEAEEIKEADAVEAVTETEATEIAEAPAPVAYDQRQDPTEAETASETPPDEPARVEAAVSEPAPEPETARAEETAAPAPPEATTAEIVPEKSVKPVDETVAAAASEILPDAPAETVEAPKPPAKKKVASLPNPSAPASEANPTARGPTKGKAGAGGTNPKAQGKASLSSYQSKLVAHLRRHRSYPNAARAKRLKGTAVVSFTIDGGGRVVGVSLARGTGHSVLDREAVAMVRRASPFPAIPPGMGKSRVTVRAPVRFEMR